MGAPPAVDAAHRAEIGRRLQALEAAEGVRIVLAIESGSRAWGFASPDSDYDVRFVYVRPQPHYLSIRVEDQRDVIERPIVDEIDLNGWDLRKALRLLARTNPAIVEWLQSPITYLERGAFRQRALALLPQVYSSLRGLHHYRHMAAHNDRAYLHGEQVRLKKYLYALRPLLAARWIAAHGTPPPIAFAELLAATELPQDVVDAVAALLARKRAGGEATEGPPVAALQRFVDAELGRDLGVRLRPDGNGGDETWAALDRLFAEVVGEAPG